MRYLPHSGKDIASMLDVIGADSLEELFRTVPAADRMKRPLAFPAPLTEWELNGHMESLANLNDTCPEHAVYIGAGCYEHFVPEVVSNLMSRSGFLTAYTPYQPEISQGTLQGIYEYQTMICRLFGMETANGSMYDGASALAEALLMALRITRKKRVALSRAIHPYYREVVRTYLSPSAFEIEEIPFDRKGTTDLSRLKSGEDLGAVAIQSPNFFGCIENLSEASEFAHNRGALFVSAFTEPIAYGLLKNPGLQGADIVCGEGRSLGLSQYYGGMSLGIFASKKEYVRNMPGRLVGRTVDRDGNNGFVVTLATREQHIRREKATSNICTNQSLCALGAAIYMATLGKTGMCELAKLNYNKAEYLKNRLHENGFEIVFDSPTFNEFLVRFPAGFAEDYEGLAGRKLFAGLDIGGFYPELEGCYLVCVTETKTKEALDVYVKEVK